MHIDSRFPLTGLVCTYIERKIWILHYLTWLHQLCSFDILVVRNSNEPATDGCSIALIYDEMKDMYSKKTIHGRNFRSLHNIIKADGYLPILNIRKFTCLSLHVVIPKCTKVIISCSQIKGLCYKGQKSAWSKRGILWLFSLPMQWIK